MVSPVNSALPLRKLTLLVASVALACLLLSCTDSGRSDVGSTNPGTTPRDNTPVVLQVEQPATSVVQDSAAILDYSNAAEGYICARSLAGDTKIKLVLDTPDGNEYQYTLAKDGSYVTVPLASGDGTYVAQLYKNVTGDKYSGLVSEDFTVDILDELKPFLYPSQYVSFAEGDQTVTLSQELTPEATNEIETVNYIYLWVVENISYDYDKAADVRPGYLPNNDDTLASKKGICFDYAVLTASMLRAQRLPCKLDIGYAGKGAYHAWIHVYTVDQGWIRKEITFGGNAWVLLDPTFDSSGKGEGDITKIIGDGSNYQTVLNY